MNIKDLLKKVQPERPIDERPKLVGVPLAWLEDPSFWDYEQRLAIAKELKEYRNE